MEVFRRENLHDCEILGQFNVWPKFVAFTKPTSSHNLPCLPFIGVVTVCLLYRSRQ